MSHYMPRQVPRCMPQPHCETVRPLSARWARDVPLRFRKQGSPASICSPTGRGMRRAASRPLRTREVPPATLSASISGDAKTRARLIFGALGMRKTIVAIGGGDIEREAPLRSTGRSFGSRTRSAPSCSSSPPPAPIPSGIGIMSASTSAGSCDAGPTSSSSSRHARHEPRYGTRSCPRTSSTSAAATHS